MMKLSVTFSALLALIPLAAAQQPIYAQCGGIGWTGGTTCVAGTTCQVANPYYSQCLPGVATGAPPPPPPTSTASAPGTSATGNLNAVAQSNGFVYFGSATDNSELSDTPYVTILKDKTQFGQITPANSMKWDATEPSRGTFTFTQGDQIANFAKQNGQLLRGHNCVWYSQLPNWVTAGNFGAADLTSIIQTHTSTVVKHYAGQIWDVINEPFNDDGSFRSDVFYNTLGTNYISIALTAARAADPNALLFINDYNIEGTGAKSTAMANLVRQLKADGVPIDGIGIEGHLIVGEVPSTIQQNIEQFVALGVKVSINELDIRMNLPSTPALLAQQEKDYQTVVTACKAVEGCVGITLWDYTDKYSWVPSTFSGQGAACPWDQNLVKKPAVSGILAGLVS